ncbi:MAG: hypothetical protein U0L10_14735, partial [Lachnospiraceae bacterium]|nr:hypothetical protein [Lachnospiraceae bacterium]
MKRVIAIGLVLTLLLSTETFGASQSSTESESAVIETTAAAEEARTPVAGVEIPITDLEPLMIGQMEDKEAGTGCTVLVCRDG